MKRKIASDLHLWRISPHHRPLLIVGAPRVGKTYLMRQFGEAEFAQTIYITPGDIAAFDITPGDTLIIIDDVVSHAEAKWTADRLLERYPDLHIIMAAQSIDHTAGFDMRRLYPLDFEEFLWAVGQEYFARLISGCNEAGLSEHHELCTRLMLHYCFTGGMPEAVTTYMSTGDFGQVRAIQSAILEKIFARIADRYPLQLASRMIRIIFSLPQQMAANNRIFSYDRIDDVVNGAQAYYADAMRVLVDMGVLNLLLPKEDVAKLNFLQSNNFDFEETPFKVYLNDTGLYGALVEAPIYDTGISVSFHDSYNGAFSELYALEQLLPNISGNIRYYHNHQSGTHIDFLIEGVKGLYPMVIEPVKMSKNGYLKRFCEHHNLQTGLRISLLRYRAHEYFPNLPLYTLPALPSWLTTHGY
ncbi:MAG: hypothetical protein NC217_07075 [Muribaculaceae bacterium]|nr:hypothetical protein [Muribaculaceae bacterium]